MQTRSGVTFGGATTAGLPGRYHVPMPIEYARSLTHHEGPQRRTRHLGVALAFVAGAANAGAFLSVKVYTSHMTGIVSSLADHIALGDVRLALAALGAVTLFLLGAMTSAVMITAARRRSMRSQFALPLLLEACLFLVFGVLGSTLGGTGEIFIPVAVLLLCFMMGLQNAVITKISGAVVRTTHLTGIITDLGIELGRLIYWNRRPGLEADPVVADLDRIKTLGALVLAFLGGGVSGALGFKQVGFMATVPLAAILFALSAVPVIDDLRRSKDVA